RRHAFLPEAFLTRAGEGRVGAGLRDGHGSDRPDGVPARLGRGGTELLARCGLRPGDLGRGSPAAGRRAGQLGLRLHRAHLPAIGREPGRHRQWFRVPDRAAGRALRPVPAGIRRQHFIAGIPEGNPAYRGPYDAYLYTGYSHLYDVEGGSLGLPRANEIYRSPPFGESRRAVLVIWRAPWLDAADTTERAAARRRGPHPPRARRAPTAGRPQPATTRS